MMKKQSGMNTPTSLFERHPVSTLLVVCALGVVGATVVTEVYLSQTAPQQLEEKYQRHIRLREHPPDNNITITPSKKTLRFTDGLEKKEYRLMTDKDGFIYPSRVHENPDLTIVFFGGSTTECMYMDEDERFPYLVGELLSANGRRVNSINSGVSGNNSMHSINLLLNKIIPLGPDVAVLMHNINDLNILLIEKTYWNSHWTRSLIFSRKKPTSLYVLARGVKDAMIPNIYRNIMLLRYRGDIDEFEDRREDSISYIKEELVARFRANLKIYISVCRNNDIIPVLMTQANRFNPEPDTNVLGSMDDILRGGVNLSYTEYRKLAEAFGAAIRRVGLDEGVTVIDLERNVPKTREFMYDAVHYNPHGSRYVAEYIARRLINLQPFEPSGHPPIL